MEAQRPCWIFDRSNKGAEEKSGENWTQPKSCEASKKKNSCRVSCHLALALSTLAFASSIHNKQQHLSIHNKTIKP
jgi:hypothetical protein